jgi:hypothetical protein
MMWRDPAVASRFFTNTSTSSGDGTALLWLLDFATTDSTTRQQLMYHAIVSANGTILTITNSSEADNLTDEGMVGVAASGLYPLRQYRYDGLI